MNSWSDHVTFEVIGNRYENPELMKENEAGSDTRIIPEAVAVWRAK